MSAFVVEDETINKVIETALLCSPHKAIHVLYMLQPYSLTWDTAPEVAQVLLDENYRSVNALYGTQNKPHRIAFRRRVQFTDKLPAIVAAFKAADCVEYQSDNTGEWKLSLACAILDACRKALWKGLPGYEQAPW